MAKLFVSYSRRDSVTARRLIEAFRSIDQDVWVDWESIPPAVDWLEQIFRGIEEADAFIFLISPDSIASEVCKVEIARAALNNKRIIPIVLRDVDPKITPESIRKLNWTFMRETDPFEEGLQKVKTAIELDLDWLEEHRRLQVRALEWHRKKDISLLLRGRDLRNAQSMVLTATSKDPTPTDLQKTYILHSLRSERNRTVAWIATGIVLIIMAVLSLIAVNRSQVARDNEQVAIANAQLAKDNETLALKNEQVARENEQIARANEEEAKRQKAIAEENKKIAEAQRSVARAQIYQTPAELYTSTLLAIDSWQTIPSTEAEEILRKNISLLPLPVAQITQFGQINSIEFSPNGDTFVTAGSDGKTCMWKIEDGENLFCTEGLRSVNDAVFSPDGTFLVTGDQSGLIQILDAKDGTVQNAFERVKPDSASSTIQIVNLKNGNSQDENTPLEIPVRDINIRPSSGQQIAVAYGDGKIPVIDVKTGKVSSPLEISGAPQVTDFSPNGTWLAAGSESGIVTIWNLNDRKIISGLKHRNGVLTLAISPNNRVMVTGGKDNTALITDIRTGNDLFRLVNGNWVRDVAFSPDGSWFVTVSDDHRIRIWDTTNGEERLGMQQDGIITDVTVSSNGQWIATTGSDKTVRVWNAGTGAEIFQIPLSASGSRLAFSKDGKYLVSTDASGAVKIWDISVMAAPEGSLQFNEIIQNVQYSPSGDWLAASDKNRVWLLTPDPASKLTTSLPAAPTIELKATVRNVIFSPDSKFLGVVTEGNEVGIYNIANRKLGPLEVSSPVRAIAFSPDSQQFITIDSDGNLQTWNALNAELVDNPEEKYPQTSSIATGPGLLAIGSKDKITILDVTDDQTFPAIESLGDNAHLVFNNDGSLMAATDSSGQVTVWKYLNSEFTKLISFVKEPADSLVFNPQGNLLGLGTAKNVFLIDAATGEEIARIPHIDIVNGVSFSSDGAVLVTASSKVLQFWDMTKLQQIKNDDLIATACSRLLTNFSKAQWAALFGAAEYKMLCENLPVP